VRKREIKCVCTAEFDDDDDDDEENSLTLSKLEK
jgi:hypothetical protein